MKSTDIIDVILPQYQVRASFPVPGSLTATEITLLRLLVQGKTVSDIAARRQRSTKTISFQKNKLYEKMGITHDLTLWRDLFFRHNLRMTPLSGDEYAVPGGLPLVPRELVRLALDNDELVPWFQPVVSACTGRLTGCEILMRQRATRTAVSLPEAFIMQAEISGLIVPVTCGLMEKAKDALLPVRDCLPPGFHVSVNVTAECVISPVFEAACQRFLHAFGKDSSVTLMAELTERTPFPVTNDVRAALRRLRRAGVRIALDDFGTGFCGYSYLQAFPVDIVKLDKRFVQNAESDLVAGHVIDAVVSLSRKCGFRVTAEGVETLAHASAMKEQGVDYLQGYFYSAPVEAESFIREWTGK